MNEARIDQKPVHRIGNTPAAFIASFGNRPDTVLLAGWLLGQAEINPRDHIE